MVREEGKQVHNDAWTLPLPMLQSLCPRHKQHRCVSEQGPSYWSKSTVFPFLSALLQIRGGSEPRRPTGAHFTGNEVLRGTAASL